MVILPNIHIRRRPFHSRSQMGALATDLMIAVCVLTIGILPLAYSYSQETKLARSLYYHSIAMQIVDGEMEILRAGEWATHKQGLQQPYPIASEAARNLPPGTFSLSIENKHIRLEWKAQKKNQGGHVVREGVLP